MQLNEKQIEIIFENIATAMTNTKRAQKMAKKKMIEAFYKAGDKK